ncbi:MAG: hypothetical protein JNL38_13115 [Myxococcales bacterium]|jgi:hypothetical protein|nr:hypothetical protein [Myxococcales bacterium]
MSRRKVFRSVFVMLAPLGLVPTLAACPKKPDPVVDAGAPPPPPAVEDAAPLDLQPEGSDAGDAGDGDAAPDAKKYTGPYVPANVVAIRQCCAQISAQAKSLGVSPEAGFLMGLAAQCNQTANAVQANPNSPEVAMFKNAMAGRNLPPVCRSF